MTPRQIEYVQAIIKYGSIRRACTPLFVTEATISVQINKLEEELGITLFYNERKPKRGLRLTDAGQQLLPDLEFYLQVHNDVFRRAEQLREQAEKQEASA